METEKTKEKLSILVDSFDGNSDVWTNFFTVFDHFWPDCPYKRYLATNEKEINEPNLITIKTGADPNWFTCTLAALRTIETDYVWLFLDDYYLSKRIINQTIENIINIIISKDVFFYRISLRGGLDSNKEYVSPKNSFIYVINLQPAIWERKKLIKILEQLQNEGCRTPWDFERYFIDYYEKNDSDDIVDGVLYDTRDLMGYKNAIIQGKWVRHVLKYYKKTESLTLDPGDRGYMPIRYEILDYIKRIGHHLLNYSTRKKIKTLFKKMGIKFMTK